MNIYFSGIGGVGIGPLARIAHDAGHTVSGSDLSEGLMTRELRADGVEINIGQDGAFLEASHQAAPIDWFVYTSALPEDHPELIKARELGIHASKRDEFLAKFIDEHNLTLIAVAGTHGKTTTTGMLIWTFLQLGVPVSYSVGSTLTFGSSGAYQEGSRFFVYECDEFDRNFLHFSPALSLITSFDYDHPDTYPTEEEYHEAFRTFLGQSDHAVLWANDAERMELQPSDNTWILGQNEVADLQLPGEHNRRNASLVLKALEFLEIASDSTREALNNFPGTDRRFEKLDDNLYTDYGHHPSEIAATLELARELSDHVVLVYQPHQNRRQHHVRHEYTDIFERAEEIYWLPTYLTREDPNQETLTPEQLTADITNKQSVHYAELDDTLWSTIQTAQQAGKLVLCMGAGTIDGWLRQHVSQD